MRLTPTWILGLLMVMAPVAAMYVAAQLPSCSLFYLDTTSCAGGWFYLPVIDFAIKSPLMFGALAVIAARPSSAVWSHIRRALLLLLGGLAILWGIGSVVSVVQVFELDITVGVALFLPAAALIAIGVSALIELWLDFHPSGGPRASEA